VRKERSFRDSVANESIRSKGGVLANKGTPQIDVIADVADRGLGRLSWADSAPAGSALEGPETVTKLRGPVSLPVAW
jgi:hypothetical protein